MLRTGRQSIPRFGTTGVLRAELHLSTSFQQRNIQTKSRSNRIRPEESSKCTSLLSARELVRFVTDEENASNRRSASTLNSVVDVNGVTTIAVED